MTQKEKAEAPIIELRHVDKHYGDLHVLKDISLEVDRGEVVVVIGPSGSGKSTMCRTINRLETIDSGDILIEGEPLPQEGKKLTKMRAELGMVFQSFNLFAHMTVLENVTLGPIQALGMKKDEAKEISWTPEEEGAEEKTVEVTVTSLKTRVMPELTDELVKSDFGFDSIDAMRDAIKIEIEQDKASRLPAEKENRCVSALAERLQLDEMDADYEQSVFEELGQNFLSNLAARGMTLDTWLPASGLTMEQFIGDLHKQANDVARESLALDALARELKIEVTEDDINAEFEKAGVKDVEASKAEFIADGRMPAVRESIRRSKAVDHLVENAKVTEVDETAKDAE